MASEKTMKFIEDIKALSVLELAELVEAIQEEFGVTAAVAAAPAAGGAGAAAEEKTEFDVVLTGFGDKKMGVIKAVKDVLLAQLVGSLQGPIQKLAALLQAVVDKNGEAA